MCKGPVAVRDQSELSCSVESGFKDVQRGWWKPGRCPGHVREMLAGPGCWQWKWTVVEGLEKQVKLVGTRWGRGCGRRQDEDE